MSGNCSIEDSEYPTKEDYKIISKSNNLFNNRELWFLVMSLFWRYEFD
jgi:hypothetical protein